MTYVVEPDVKLNTDLRFDIVWRDDQLGRTAGSSGNLGVYRLNVEYDAYRSEALSFKLVFGRQAFSIGGVPNDYILAGTLDALSAVADFGKLGAYASSVWTSSAVTRCLKMVICSTEMVVNPPIIYVVRPTR